MNWEDAALAATTSTIEIADPRVPPKIETLRIIIDRIIDSGATDEPQWQYLGSVAFNLAVDWGMLSRDAEVSAVKIADLLTRKQRDYGPDNIARFGMVGLYVRMHDKIARLENLLKKGTAPNNESITDNLIDIIGYSVIAVMFERGQFFLPLRATVAESN